MYGIVVQKSPELSGGKHPCENRGPPKHSRQHKALVIHYGLPVMANHPDRPLPLAAYLETEYLQRLLLSARIYNVLDLYNRSRPRAHLPFVILRDEGINGPFCARRKGSTAAETGVDARVGTVLRLCAMCALTK